MPDDRKRKTPPEPESSGGQSSADIYQAYEVVARDAAAKGKSITFVPFGCKGAPTQPSHTTSSRCLGNSTGKATGQAGHIGEMSCIYDDGDHTSVYDVEVKGKFKGSAQKGKTDVPMEGPTKGSGKSPDESPAKGHGKTKDGEGGPPKGKGKAKDGDMVPMKDAGKTKDGGEGGPTKGKGKAKDGEVAPTKGLGKTKDGGEGGPTKGKGKAKDGEVAYKGSWKDQGWRR